MWTAIAKFLEYPIAKIGRLAFKGWQIILATAIIVAAVSIASPAAHAASSGATIRITGPARPPGFYPDILTVHVNDTVTFVNNAYPAATFTLQADNGSFTSLPIAPNQQWTTHFSAAGTYSFHTLGHPTAMVGAIIVVASSVALLPTLTSDQETQAIASVQHQTSPGTASGPPLALIIGGIGGIALIVIVVMVVLLRRRTRHQVG